MSSPNTGSLSAVAVVDTVEAVPHLAPASERVAALVADTELIVVANGVDDACARALAEAVVAIPDATLLFLPEPVDRDAAVLIGMENAVGDRVLVLTPTPSELEVIGELVDVADADLVIAAPRRPAQRSMSLYRGLQRLFYALYGRVSGFRPEADPAPLRCYSRAAALHLVNRFDGEMLLKSRNIPGGYPGRELLLDYEQAPAARRGIGRAAGKGLRMLIGSSPLPLRLVVLLSLLTAVLALIYSAYVVGVYLFNDAVQPGWTTLSLQLSGMMLLFSLLFALLGEYTLQIHAASAPRRRFQVTREIRSPLSRRAGRLNVVDAEQQFQLGAPRPAASGDEAE